MAAAAAAERMRGVGGGGRSLVRGGPEMTKEAGIHLRNGSNTVKLKDTRRHDTVHGDAEFLPIYRWQ